jgi:hypothetical protein
VLVPHSDQRDIIEKMKTQKDILENPRAQQRLKGEIHRVDPDFGSTLTASHRDSQPNCWVNWKIMGQPCDFQV